MSPSAVIVPFPLSRMVAAGYDLSTHTPNNVSIFSAGHADELTKKANRPGNKQLIITTDMNFILSDLNSGIAQLVMTNL